MLGCVKYTDEDAKATAERSCRACCRPTAMLNGSIPYAKYCACRANRSFLVLQDIVRLSGICDAITN
jgi:hypothetical protein